MKVLVTGGCGFLGSHVCEFFLKQGWQVVALDNLSKFELERSSYNIEATRNLNYNVIKSLGIPLQKTSITSVDTMEQCIKNSFAGGPCDLVIHTAAQPAMTIATESPILDFNTNAFGTVCVLEAARRCRVPVAICSTIHVYGTGINDTLVEGKTRYSRAQSQIAEEDSILTGELTPLHASKRTAEIYGRMYSEAYGLPVANFRLTGIYGPRQLGTEDHGWMALLAIKVLQGKPIRIIGTGKQVRDPLYVEDVARAFMFWYDCEAPAGTYNICGSLEHQISILEYIAMLERLTGKKAILEYGDERQGDLMYFVGNNAEALMTFNWEPTIRVEEGVTRMLDWLKGNLAIF